MQAVLPGYAHMCCHVFWRVWSSLRAVCRRVYHAAWAGLRIHAALSLHTAFSAPVSLALAAATLALAAATFVSATLAAGYATPVLVLGRTLLL